MLTTLPGKMTSEICLAVSFMCTLRIPRDFDVELLYMYLYIYMIYLSIIIIYVSDYLLFTNVHHLLWVINSIKAAAMGILNYNSLLRSGITFILGTCGFVEWRISEYSSSLCLVPPSDNERFPEKNHWYSCSIFSFWNYCFQGFLPTSHRPRFS